LLGDDGAPVRVWRSGNIAPFAGERAAADEL